jgi:hypothetical protein
VKTSSIRRSIFCKKIDFFSRSRHWGYHDDDEEVGANVGDANVGDGMGSGSNALLEERIREFAGLEVKGGEEDKEEDKEEKEEPKEKKKKKKSSSSIK